MNIFKNYTYSWWQVGLLKLALLCFGIVIGAHWSDVFAPFIIYLIFLGIALAIYMGFISLRQ